MRRTVISEAALREWLNAPNSATVGTDCADRGCDGAETEAAVVGGRQEPDGPGPEAEHLTACD